MALRFGPTRSAGMVDVLSASPPNPRRVTEMMGRPFNTGYRVEQPCWAPRDRAGWGSREDPDRERFFEDRPELTPSEQPKAQRLTRRRWTGTAGRTRFPHLDAGGPRCCHRARS